MEQLESGGNSADDGLGVGTNLSSISGDESHSVLSLVILGDVGRGNEQSRLTKKAKLGNSNSTGARNNEVGSRVSQVHSVDERAAPKVGRALVGHKCVDLRFVELAGLPDDVDGLRGEKVVDVVFHHIVESTRAERTTDDQKSGPVRGEAEVAQSLGARRERGEVTAKRVTGEHETVGGKEAIHTLVSNANLTGTFSQQFVCEARVGVLFLDNGGNAQRLGSAQNRSRSVTTEPNHDVGPETTNNLSGEPKATNDLEGQQKVTGVELTVEPVGGKTLDGVTQSGDLLHLHLTKSTDEQQLDIATEPTPKSLGNCNSGVDVTTGTTTGQNYLFHSNKDSALGLSRVCSPT